MQCDREKVKAKGGVLSLVRTTFGFIEDGAPRVPGLVFDGIEGVGSTFHILRSLTHFWRYRGHRAHFSCFALSDSFSSVPRASDPLFMFYAL
jgi:hypothetical protein